MAIEYLKKNLILALLIRIFSFWLDIAREKHIGNRP
jgi:hypothetical protein